MHSELPGERCFLRSSLNQGKLTSGFAAGVRGEGPRYTFEHSATDSWH